MILDDLAALGSGGCEGDESSADDKAVVGPCPDRPSRLVATEPCADNPSAAHGRRWSRRQVRRPLMLASQRPASLAECRTASAREAVLSSPIHLSLICDAEPDDGPPVNLECPRPLLEGTDVIASPRWADASPRKRGYLRRRPVGSRVEFLRRRRGPNRGVQWSRPRRRCRTRCACTPGRTGTRCADALGEFEGGAEEVDLGDDAGDEAELDRALGGDRLAGE